MRVGLLPGGGGGGGRRARKRGGGGRGRPPPMKGVGMLIGNFELIPKRDQSGRGPSFF